MMHRRSGGTRTAGGSSRSSRFRPPLGPRCWPRQLHRLSILGYDAVRPAAPDEELARVASGAALWTLAEAITWATVEDVLAPLPNPFLAKLRLFELGHWPLGVWQGAIAVM